jgi:hypothetical protein
MILNAEALARLLTTMDLLYKRPTSSGLSAAKAFVLVTFSPQPCATLINAAFPMRGGSWKVPNRISYEAMRGRESRVQPEYSKCNIVPWDCIAAAESEALSLTPNLDQVVNAAASVLIRFRYPVNTCGFLS